MALADICQLQSVLTPNKMIADHEDMIQCTNFDNNYQLEMPPFENVSVF